MEKKFSKLQTENEALKERVETAEALAKAGVITKQDLENIKKEADKEFEKLIKTIL